MGLKQHLASAPDRSLQRLRLQIAAPFREGSMGQFKRPTNKADQTARNLVFGDIGIPALAAAAMQARRVVVRTDTTPRELPPMLRKQNIES
jgi:hypothetical protein